MHITASPNRPASKRLGQDLLDDWASLVRTARPADLEALLASTGYRPYPGALRCEPRDAADPVRVEHQETAADLERFDRRLATLVFRAGTDPEAARVVLQRLLPGLLAIARRRSQNDRRLTPEMYDELLANAWIVIRCYPIERRPSRVAANLLRDIEYQTFVRPARLRRVATTPIDEEIRSGHDERDEFRFDEAPGSFAEVVALLRAAADAGMEQDDLRLAAALASGRSINHLAAQRSRTPRAERYRRARVLARLREIADDGDDAL
jgi:hypothetical protein